MNSFYSKYLSQVQLNLLPKLGKNYRKFLHREITRELNRLNSIMVMTAEMGMAVVAALDSGAGGTSSSGNNEGDRRRQNRGSVRDGASCHGGGGRTLRRFDDMKK